MKLRHIPLLVLAALLLAACAAPGSGSLAGTSWELISLDGSPVGGQPVTLQFTSASEVGGFGGCNSYGGSYRAGIANISFSNIVSTLMACADANITNLEGAYFQALDAASSYSIVECESCANPVTLTLTGGGHTLVFVASNQ